MLIDSQWTNIPPKDYSTVTTGNVYFGQQYLYDLMIDRVANGYIISNLGKKYVCNSDEDMVKLILELFNKEKK